ncbi:MAG: leucyl/phenylalanyl-tRNA--protein transferase [Thioploca sp.]|nr:leucyl/phenylalanyl-tRNA--protein transferase [Thioploca sp.]
MRRPYWIPAHASPYDFPPLENALEHPDGLLAIGGDLTPRRIMVAYRQGIFPWYSEDQPILWWSPSQRLVLFPECLKISRSLAKTLRQNKFTVTMDQSFAQVIQECAGPRRHQPGTWITEDIKIAYAQLHHYHFAHSVETWYQGQLVGGLYGVSLGKVFFGESMFSKMSDASKVALVYLVRQLQWWGYELIDCQVHTQHLQNLGAVEISRQHYRTLLDRLSEQPGKTGIWQLESQEIDL